MLTTEQLIRRKNGLGGSDIAAILGLDPYRTAYDIYLDKTSPVLVGQEEEADASPEEELGPKYWGNALEDAIAEGYEKRTGFMTTKSDTIYHPLYPYLFAHPDRLIKGTDKGLEIKNVGYRQAHLWGDESRLIIPEQYLIQIVHYILVTGFDSWDIAALIGGNKLLIKTFHNDEKISSIRDKIEEESTRFWRQHVEKKIPPTFIPNAHSKNSLLKYYSTIEEKEIFLSKDVLKHKENYLKHTKLVTQNKALADSAKAHILKEMENASKAVFPDGSICMRKSIHVNSYTVPERDNIRLTFNNKSIF